MFDKLVKGKLDIGDIALLGMSSGTPSMPGPKIEPYNIITIENKDENEPQLYNIFQIFQFNLFLLIKL